MSQRKGVGVMKRTKFVALLLMSAAAALLLCACGPSEAEKVAELAGTWVTEYPAGEDAAVSLLENNDFYEEEIALIDTTTLHYAEQLTFNTDKTYSISVPAEQLQENVRAFFEGAFDALYEGRASLSEVYGVDLDSASQAEFQQFYAEVYGQQDFSSLLDLLASESFAYDEFTDLETGTFKIRGNTLDFTDNSDENSGYTDYELVDDLLTIHYVEGAYVYTRAD